MAAISLQNPRILLALPLLGLIVLAFAWRRRFRPLGTLLLRLILVFLAIAALAQPAWLPALAAAEPAVDDPGRTVILVDQSASLGPSREALRSEAARLAGESQDSVVLLFADRPVVTNDVVGAGQPLDVELTNLANALSLGAEMLKGQGGRLVLLSDGVPTMGDTEGAVTQLAKAGVPVDVMIPGRGQSPAEVRIVGLQVPPRLRLDETFTAEIAVHSSHPTSVTLTFSQNDEALEQDQVILEPGLNLFSFDTQAEDIGPHVFHAAVTAGIGQDVQNENNALSAFTQVYARPKILVVGEDSGQMARFSLQLTEAGFEPHDIPPSALSDRLSDLEPYAGMVLLNVSARSFELEQMIAAQEFVQTLGRGLLVTGGRNSFSLGHYADTPLEELLPVSLEPPPREERPPVALLLIIDHSGSMASRQDSSKLAMAKEAAIRATDVLGPEDLIGVLVFDSNSEWIVPFQQVQDGAAFLELQRKIATIPAGGGTDILGALEEGLLALAEQNPVAGASHAVLLTDGKSYDAVTAGDRYDAAVDNALRQDITLSTIAIGADADQDLLTYLAERGLGRYHFAGVPEDIPDLTIAESAILNSDALQEGRFRPTAFMPHPLLRGLAPSSGDAQNALPPLNGYVGLTIKPLAEKVLQVGPGDPLLGAWGYGLGRVAAWTSDTGEEWAADWTSGPGSERFWGQLVGYLLPPPDLGLLQLKADVAPDGVVTISAEGVTETGQPVDLARTRASLVAPSGSASQLNLVQTAPGRYQQRVRIDDAGAFQLTVTQSREEEPDESATIGFVVPYPAEYGLPAPDAGEALLRDIAAKTGGDVMTIAAPVKRGTLAASTDDAPAQPVELWPWLLIAALTLWPMEIAWRRRARLRIQ